jgi:CO/xanthine dehydrogenase FAD-binding subunit
MLQQIQNMVRRQNQMNDVNYFAPNDFGEALKVKAQYGEEAKILAGGTDLMPKINEYKLFPKVILYVGNLRLNYIRETDKGLVIGAATSVAALLDNALITKNAAILAQAAEEHSSPGIRAAGTIGGNIMNASPAADLAAALYALDAELTLAAADGERIVRIESFFKGPGKTDSAPGEILKEIVIPAQKGTGVFLKLGKRKAQVLSVISAAVKINVEAGRIAYARVALGSVAPTIIRARKAEELLIGQAPSPDVLRSAAVAAIAESSPIDDIRATAWYRREAGLSIVKKALFAAAGLEYTD